MGEVTHCRGCGERLPAPFLDLGAMPPANRYLGPQDSTSDEPAYPLAVAACAHCHLVQLTHTVDPSSLFSEYAYFSSVSSSFVAHAKTLAQTLISRHGLDGSSRVVEVASNDGYLLQFFVAAGVPVLGVEPARNIAAVAQHKGIDTLAEFFGPGVVDAVLAKTGGADVLVGNNVLAHVPDINGFLRAARQVLKPGGVAVFEFPHVGELFTRNAFDTIYHEHVFYLSLTSVRFLAERAGLHLQHVERLAVHGGTLRVTLSTEAVQPSDAALALLEEERGGGILEPSTHREFAARVQTVCGALRALLGALRADGARIAAYGAPAKGNTLLCASGCGDLLEYTVDRSPHKQGLRLPGTHLPIHAPARLVTDQPDYALLLPWNLAAEIQHQQAAWQATGGRFIVPVPHPHILEPAAESAT